MKSLLISALLLAPTLSFAASTSLRQVARSRGVLIGSAVQISDLFREPVYAKFVRSEFSVVTPEYEFKFKSLSPAQGKTDYRDADRLLKFAAKNHLLIRGHTLAWHKPDALPAWLRARKFSPSELRTILKNHVEKTVRHFAKAGRGIVFCWDVANEVFDSDGHFRTDSIWAPVAPNATEFLALVFRWAHAADPKAKLFYNEYDIEWPGKKSEATYVTLKALKKSGVPIHGIGFQMHHGPDLPNIRAIRATLKKFAALGLEIHITEYDFALRDSEKTPEALAKQAAAYSELASLCASIHACKAFVTWGFIDRDSWIPKSKPGLGRPAMLGDRFAPKPSYYALKKAFSGKR